MEVFSEIALIIGLAAVVSFVMRLLKQPMIVGYIITGIIAGPYALDILHHKETIELFSKLGITMLLFIVGIHLSPQVMKEVGKVSVIAGLSQIFVTATIGFAIAVFLGLDKTAAMYVGIALTFSSTIIILKLLSDKGDIHKLYGKLSIALLLMQDIIASVILILTAAVSKPGSENILLLLAFTLLKGVALITIVLLVSGYLLPRLVAFMAKSQESLFLFSIAWGMGMAALFHFVGFSVEIGALVAGVSLASTVYAHEISSRMRPLRDFFVVTFFIFLGTQMELNNITAILTPALILSFFVLMGNPVIVIIIMNLMGYNKRTSFMAGITITQMSEFSLILATLGFQVGHLSKEVLSLITLVGLITITFSTYLISNAHHLYKYVSRLLTVLELRKNKKAKKNEETIYDAMLFGHHRVGEDFVKAFKKLNVSFVVIDFNPERTKYLDEEGIPHKYGDAEDAEFLQEFHLAKLKIVVSTIPDAKTNEFIIQSIRNVNKKAIIIVKAYNIQEAHQLYKYGASYVIMPDYLAAQHASRIIREFGIDKERFEGAKERHMTYLEKREV